MGERLSRFVRRAIVGLLWAGALYYLFLGGEFSVFELRELQQERDEAALQVDSLRQAADSLEARAESLSTSPRAVERVARERHGFVRDGEHLYRFVPMADGDGEGGNAP